MKIKLNDHKSIDLSKLIESRLLIQANSGGGKSWAIRRIVEQAFGKVQIIVIDPEGEFSNLRQEHDFVYIAKDGDAPATVRSAALLAQRLMETKASAIIDLYEIPGERKAYVKAFLDALVNLPKELWQDCLIIIDECHQFAPEKDESMALQSVSNLASLGRKRGYCLIAASGRPAKLNKDVAAECNNKLIGRATLDVDRKRNADEIGLSDKKEVLGLRNLEPGNFYTFGPAISNDVEVIKIGDIQVKPPKRGALKSAPPKPTAAVKQILSKLADLPKEAEKQALTMQELHKKVAQLSQELKKKDVATKPSYISDPKATDRALAERDIEWEGKLREATREINRLAGTIDKISKAIGTESITTTAVITAPPKKTSDGVRPTSSPHGNAGIPARYKPERGDSEHDTRSSVPSDALTGPEQKILDAIAWMESIGVHEPEQTAVAFLAGYTYGGGGFNNPKGSLRTKELVEYRGRNIALTDLGREVAQAPDNVLTQEELHAKVLGVLGGPEQRILKPLLEQYPESIKNEELAGLSGYTYGSGGFNNPKGRLRTLGLIEYLPGGFSKARDILFI